MKIAYILPDWPLPCFRGYQRIAFERIKRLAARHEVDVFYFSPRTGDTSGHTPETLGCRAVHRVEFSRRRAWGNALLAFLRGEPAQVGYYHSEAMQRRVTTEMHDRRYEAMVVQLVRLAQFLPAGFAGPAVVDMVDPLSLSFRRSLAWRRCGTRWFFRLEAHRLKNYERATARRVSSVVLVSADEKEEYSALIGASNVRVVPYAVDTEKFRPVGAARQAGMIVLSGNLGYAPNIDAVNYFCGQVFPLVRQAEPGAMLYLVGVNPAAEVKKWGDGQHIVVTGAVPDVALYLQRAMVSVCPVRLRVGTQTKILEAMATGTPVVAAVEATSGFPGAADIIRSAADEHEYAAAVVALLRGEDWERIARASRDYVMDNFSWDASVAMFESLLRAGH
ncbi:MAG: glycosyltransferase [Verrucomicrobiota bacterium]